MATMQEMFVYDDRKGEIVHRKIDYVPALYKIFDEILVGGARKKHPGVFKLVFQDFDKSCENPLTI